MGTMIVVGIAALMAMVTLLVVIVAWSSVSRGIRDLDGRVKDYVLIAPTGAGVRSVSARYFEALMEVCDAAKAERVAYVLHDRIKEDATGLISDVDKAWKDYMNANANLKVAVDRLVKMEAEHGICRSPQALEPRKN